MKDPKPSDSQAQKDKTAQEQDDFLEESLEETFPASDPIAPGHPHRPSDDQKNRKPG